MYGGPKVDTAKGQIEGTVFLVERHYYRDKLGSNDSILPPILIIISNIDVPNIVLRLCTGSMKDVSPLKLPTYATRMVGQNDDGARYAFQFSRDLSANLVSLSRDEGVTLFMTLFAAFQVLLYRLSGLPDIVVGTDAANCTHIGLEISTSEQKAERSQEQSVKRSLQAKRIRSTKNKGFEIS